jgi:hypothetical protein
MKKNNLKYGFLLIAITNFILMFSIITIVALFIKLFKLY